MISGALGRLADGMTEATDSLSALLKAEGESVRLGAARSLIELTVKLREHGELAQSVDELKRLLPVGRLHHVSDAEPSNAVGGTRTRTGLPPGDFKSPASAIPPPRPMDLVLPQRRGPGYPRTFAGAGFRETPNASMNPADCSGRLNLSFTVALSGL
jgi:hypothetical protein